MEHNEFDQVIHLATFLESPDFDALPMKPEQRAALADELKEIMRRAAKRLVMRRIARTPGHPARQRVLVKLAARQPSEAERVAGGRLANLETYRASLAAQGLDTSETDHQIARIQRNLDRLAGRTPPTVQIANNALARLGWE